MIVREGSRRVVTVHLFMFGRFALTSMCDETPKTAGVSAEVQLTREKQPPLRDEKGRFSQKKTHSKWKPTRSGNPLEVETHSRWKHGRQNSWDKGVEGKEEIRVSRNGRRLVHANEKRNPFKSGVV